jgi:hypothetical protein
MTTPHKRILAALRKLEHSDPHYVHYDERDFIPLLKEAGIPFEPVRHEPLYPLVEDSTRPRYELRFKIANEQGSESEVEIIFNWQYRLALLTITESGWL